MVQGKIYRGRHTNHPAGHHSIWTNQCPSPPSPIFTRIHQSKQEGQHPLTGQRAPPISGGT